MLLIFILILTKCHAHIPVNSSDVIMVGGHADLPAHDVIVVTQKMDTEAGLSATNVDNSERTTVGESFRREDDGYIGGDEEKDIVVFLTTEADPWMIRNDDYLHGESVKIADVLKEDRRVTDPPDDNGIYFVTGKNEEKILETSKERMDKRRNNKDEHVDFYLGDETTTKKPKKPLDCTNLDCNITIDSVCGSRQEAHYWKYRLFMNDCYFRKVNCAFTYEANRYVQVNLSRCNNADAHKSKILRQRAHPQGIQYFPVPVVRYESGASRNDGVFPRTRRVNGRRAMSLDFRSNWCGHACPTICPDEQAPVCAISTTGSKKVFLNHCKLDQHSCRYGVMWQDHPLHDCIGAKKAEQEQNKPFINWMQRVGLVDKKGKLVLE